MTSLSIEDKKLNKTLGFSCRSILH